MSKLIFYIALIAVSNVAAQQTVGLFVNEPEAMEGYVLFSNNTDTYLINNCGLIVNQWQSDFKPGAAVYLLENGNLLRTIELKGDFEEGGLGGGFELYSWEGELLWWHQYSNELVHAHHDIEPLPNGNFLLIAWEKHPESDARQAGRQFDGPVWSERIVELEMVGNQNANVVWEWRLWDHLVQDFDSAVDNFGIVADHPELVDINYIGEGQTNPENWIHLNSIDYNERLDQIVVSSRLFNEIWIIDHSTSTLEARSHSGGNSGKGGDLLYRFGNPEVYDRGTSADKLFSHQHDARWVDAGIPHDGKLMVFNNEALPGRSRIETWLPPVDEEGNYMPDANEAYGPATTDWIYFDDTFYSRIMSGAHFLENGNLFVCEGFTGRFFEVTPDNEIVWEYINPVNSNGSPGVQGGTPRFNQTFRATKYKADYPAFIDRNMEPSAPVEINPWESDCYELISTPQADSQIEVFNLVGNEVIIHSGFSDENIRAALTDYSGRQLRWIPVHPGRHSYTFEEVVPGFYILIFYENTEFESAKKIVLH